ncbi:MAG: hypothetical protein J6K92_06350 [Oscillospiraceae bacterium]|nr:hypothetical protein [Oscillospiraceae bacterium]
MKKLPYDLIFRVTAIILMTAALLSACFGSIQSTKAILLPIEFQGEYSPDNGKT